MKTETKHTPGPWMTQRSHSGRTIYAETQRDFEIKETRILAFMVRNEAQFPVEQSDANARLIAAAPELLAALIGMVNRYRDKSLHSTCDASISARAAISKAEGNA